MIDAHLNKKVITITDIENAIIGARIDRIRFVLASSVNREDLTNLLYNWYVLYMNKYVQGTSVLLEPVYEDNLIKLPWVPDSLATQVSGRLQILIYAAIIVSKGKAAIVDKKWVSEAAVVYVQENLNPKSY